MTSLLPFLTVLTIAASPHFHDIILSKLFTYHSRLGCQKSQIPENSGPRNLDTENLDPGKKFKLSVQAPSFRDTPLGYATLEPNCFKLKLMCSKTQNIKAVKMAIDNRLKKLKCRHHKNIAWLPNTVSNWQPPKLNFRLLWR